MTGRMIGIAGKPGSDKSSFVVDLVGELTRRGLTVSTMMGVDDQAAIDQPGKDSFRHRDAGAEEVMVTSAQRWALIHGGGVEKHGALAQMTIVDLVISEGMTGDDYPLIEVHSVDADAPPLGRDDPAIVAIVSDGPLDGQQQPVIDRNDLPAVADFIVAHMGLA